METVQKATSRQTSSLIKKYLKREFGIKCAVRSNDFSGGNSLTIEYCNGPDSDLVSAIFKKLEYGKFDASTDSYDYKNDSEYGLVIDNMQLQNFKYVIVQRIISEDILISLSKNLSANGKFFGSPEVKVRHDMFTIFSTPVKQCYNWWELSRKLLNNISFVTSESNIEIMESHYENMVLNITYKFNNKLHNTSK